MVLSATPPQPANNHPIMQMLGKVIGFMQSHNQSVRIFDFIASLGMIVWGYMQAINWLIVVGAVLFAVALVNPYGRLAKFMASREKNMQEKI